jgi:hypothetical protein
LEIALLQLKIDQTKVQTEATVATTGAKIEQGNAAAAQKAEGAEGEGGESAPKPDRLAEISEALLMAVQEMSRPKKQRVVRDMNGRVSHVETVQ